MTQINKHIDLEKYSYVTHKMVCCAVHNQLGDGFQELI